MRSCLFSAFLILTAGLSTAQTQTDSETLAQAGSAPEEEASAPAPSPTPRPSPTPAPAAAEAAAEEGVSEAERTSLNLLGEVDAKGGEAQRNENVRLTLIDNNVQKELNQRMGATATITAFEISQGYFGREFGGSPEKMIHLPPLQARPLHGQVFWGHNNSLLTARSFFQVGGVKPARTNDYGFTVGVPGWKNANFTINGSQRKLRGQVNGNVLVPGADERTPLTMDPDDRPIVEAILGAYPLEVPNIDPINKPTALNTNAAQNVNNDRLGAILDQSIGDRDRLILKYGLTLQNVEAFQLVGGQNPDTTTKNHQARATWSRAWSPQTSTDFSIGYDRIASLLVPDETSIGSYFLFSRILESIGPSSQIPINRAQNLFRYSGQAQHIRGKHTLTAGVEILRRQINGSENDAHRGTFSFRDDFGNDVITNLRLGRASSYNVTIGGVHRGFRDWKAQFYVGDVWRASSKLSLNAGLRYRPVSAPTEVNGLSEVPYGCDCNNFAPSFGFAYRPTDWSVIRGSYGVFYGEIFPATFMQARFNPPGNLGIQVNAPNLANPLKDFSEEDLDPTARASIRLLDDNLRTPYSHQYNLSWELSLPSDWSVEMGYVGSRSHKLLTVWWENRARPSPDFPQKTSTINDRRPDQRYYDVRHTLNGSRGYYDAAKVRLLVPRWAGITLDTSYWFSKALDLGGDYTNTGAGRDSRSARAPSEYEINPQMKGRSVFDQPHAWLTNFTYETPTPARGGWLSKVVRQWQFTSVLLLKSGTPFGVRAGSDSPGIGNVDGASSDRPNIDDPSILGNSIDHPDTSESRIPRSAFSFIEPTERLGNLGRNVFRKDGIVNLNVGLSRRFTLRGDRAVMLRADSLNLLNHPQFAEPGASVSAANFGQIANTLNDGRTFRFMLRLYF